jgi:eukaryotic-like serine/threonine-protein kinase
MTTTLACLDETELLALAMGEPVAAAITAHLGGCALCRRRLDRLQAEVASLRQNHGQGTTPGSTEQPEPAHDAEAPNAGATMDWKSSERPGAHDTDRFGPEAVAAARAAAEGEDAMPDTIGRYKVVGWLGYGGEADVYRVVHIKLGNDLVLKLSHRRVGADSQSRLVEQGRLLVDLEHPNLVRIYDLDFHDNRPFLVMEYVHGSDLEQYARDEPVSHRRAAALVAKLAGVMAVAHRHGITHCDIKPKNILIDKSREPRLIDFGMARLRHAWSDCVESTVGGTVAFMAPEQARLEVDRIGPRSDIFSLGGVLYFLLTGQAPFVGENHDEVWDRARRCDFAAGALRAAKVPRGLERICLKAMAAEPAGRFATAEALQKALNRFLVRPKVMAALAGVCGLGLVGGLVFAMVPARPEARQAQGAPVMIHQVSPAPGSLAGELTVRVWSPNEGGKRGLKIEEPGALPLLAGEKVRLEAHLNQPAHVYLLWLDGQGKVSQLYPRDDRKYGSQPSGGAARDTVESPAALDEGHPMKGAGGLETVLLLARRTPLAEGTNLAGLIGPLSPSPLRNELEIAKRGGDEGQPIVTLNVNMHRSIDDETAKIDDPLLQLMERLRTQYQFDVIKAVRFAYRGE